LESRLNQSRRRKLSKRLSVMDSGRDKIGVWLDCDPGPYSFVSRTAARDRDLDL
jgi:hypothetical protein